MITAAIITFIVAAALTFSSIVGNFVQIVHINQVSNVVLANGACSLNSPKYVITAKNRCVVLASKSFSSVPSAQKKYAGNVVRAVIYASNLTASVVQITKTMDNVRSIRKKVA